MGYCGNCGTKLDDGVKFCPECGKAVYAGAERNAEQNSTPESMIKCPKCGCDKVMSRQRGWSWDRAFGAAIMTFLTILFIAFAIMSIDKMPTYIDTIAVILLWFRRVATVAAFFIGGLRGRHTVVLSCLKCGNSWFANNAKPHYRTKK